MRKRPSRSISRPQRRPSRRRRYKVDLKRLSLSVMLMMLVVVLSIALYKSQYLYVTHVNVKGVKTISAKDVISRVRLAPETNILFGINKGAITHRVKTNPVVREVLLYRKLPDTLLVYVTERKAGLILNTGNKLYEVDATGVPFRVAKQLPSGLPCIQYQIPKPPVLGQPIMRMPFRAAMQSLALARNEGISGVEKITVDQNNDLCLNVRDGFQIKLGRPERLPEKLKTAAMTIQRIPEFRRRGEYVDVTCLEAPAWKPRKPETP